jgi:acyl carrier protein
MGRERQMEDVASKITDILKKNMKDPPETISLDTKLSDLEIESLDLAVIVFDIEDAFGIQIPYKANEEMTDFATVGSVVERVQSLVKEKDGAAGAAA